MSIYHDILPHIQRFMADGEVHSAKEVYDYVSAQMGRGQIYPGGQNLSSALRLMESEGLCEKVGRGKYVTTRLDPAVQQQRRIENLSKNMLDVEAQMAELLPALPEDSAARERVSQAVTAIAQARQALGELQMEAVTQTEQGDFADMDKGCWAQGQTMG